ALALLAAAGTLVPVGSQSSTLAVGYVQGGAPGGGVYGLGTARTITRNQVAETYRLAAEVASGALPQPAFVVWPENGTDMDPTGDAETASLVRAAVSRAGVPVLVGTILDGPGADERQTASLWWDPVDGVVARYVKRGIVPFGEWVPFRDLLLPLIPELRYVGAQSIAGTAPGVLPVNAAGVDVTLGVLVCYDLVFDDFVYDTVREGGQILLVQSSNAMYQGTGQIEQQFAITRVRARELRREMLVVTTSGLTGLINPDGSVAFTEPEHEAASGVVDLPVRDGVTPAAWLASWIEAGIVLAALVGFGLSLAHERMNPTGSRTGEANVHGKS
ncbi:MAG: apolipoprotein N-acyltransferase, partial [Propionicimonas sp.]